MADKDIDILYKELPALEIIFQSGEIFHFDWVSSMQQYIKNNFKFKNTYIFTTNVFPLELLHMLENHEIHQIKEVKIIETLRAADGEKIFEVNSIKLPIFSVERKIDKTGFSTPWIIKIIDIHQ